MTWVGIYAEGDAGDNGVDEKSRAARWRAPVCSHGLRNVRLALDPSQCRDRHFHQLKGSRLYRSETRSPESRMAWTARAHVRSTRVVSWVHRSK
ncbi:hypothetical protein GALMADRAFT_694477 [Galerina marginata CBS 339.88]|uniref:Uncharacterized protein n=1 Tax=Galerina marginata (strain CBS 339.88) TaxID=685588 RepID=A0A067TLG3_GALM3|nr:hypothetical protein GALMADRAFT_694477 [Galerina marginata CBS 339.88]